MSSNSQFLLKTLFLLFIFPLVNARSIKSTLHKTTELDESLTYLWPLPSQFTFGNDTLTVDPNLSIVFTGNGVGSVIVKEAFERYKKIIFKHGSKSGEFFDVTQLTVIVHSDNDEVIYFSKIVKCLFVLSYCWDEYCVELCELCHLKNI